MDNTWEYLGWLLLAIFALMGLSLVVALGSRLFPPRNRKAKTTDQPASREPLQQS